MNRDESKARGAALRSYLVAHLPVPGARSVTALARKAGIQPTTATNWWTKGHVPDNTSLQVLADALGVGLSDLIAAYDGSAGRSWIFSDPELEALLELAVERGAERAARRVLAERRRDQGAEDLGADG
jgi:transcriptional regulator with XRE-family HTH domain